MYRDASGSESRPPGQSQTQSETYYSSTFNGYSSDHYAVNEVDEAQLHVQASSVEQTYHGCTVAYDGCTFDPNPVKDETYPIQAYEGYTPGQTFDVYGYPSNPNPAYNSSETWDSNLANLNYATPPSPIQVPSPGQTYHHSGYTLAPTQTFDEYGPSHWHESNETWDVNFVNGDTLPSPIQLPSSTYYQLQGYASTQTFYRYRYDYWCYYKYFCFQTWTANPNPNPNTLHGPNENSQLQLEAQTVTNDTDTAGMPGNLNEQLCQSDPNFPLNILASQALAQAEAQADSNLNPTVPQLEGPPCYPNPSPRLPAVQPEAQSYYPTSDAFPRDPARAHVEMAIEREAREAYERLFRRGPLYVPQSN